MQYPTQRAFRRSLRLVAPLATLALFSLTLLVPVSAQTGDPGPPTTTLNVQPVFVSGNPTCSQLLPSADFVKEIVIQNPTSGTIQLSTYGLTGTLTLSVYNSPQGQAFDFSFSGIYGVAGIVVKGGPNANFYDYRPGATRDTFLHSPVNPSNGNFYGLSHVSFCVKPLRTQLQIEKTPDSGTLTVGDKIQWKVVVTDSSDGVAATNATVTDSLQPSGFNFEIVSQGAGTTGTGGSSCSINTSVSPNTLSCSFPTLADGASYNVVVRTTTAIPVGSSLCGTTINNTAFASADNADQVSDGGQQAVACGAIRVNKTAKHAAEADDVIELAGAGFTLLSGSPLAAVNPPGEKFTDAQGVACFDGLPTNTSYTLRETTVPTGYAGAADQSVTTSAANASCSGTGSPTAVNVSNTPLTDVTVTINSQVAGGTATTITCTGTDSLGRIVNESFTTPASGDGSLSITGLGLMHGTGNQLVCVIDIDP